MPVKYMRAPLCALTAISIALLPACGGSGGVPTAAGSTQASTTPPATAPAITAPVINAVILASSNPDAANAVVTLPNGDSVSYFKDAGTSLVREAVVQSGGKSSRIYYDTDGSINRLLDVDTGDYVVVRARQDLLGSEYLSFDKNNVFNGGTAVYQSGGTWFSAPILGDMGQITATLTTPSAPAAGTSPALGAFNGAIALRATQLAYGPATPLAAGVQALLNGQVTTTSIGGRLLNMLIPSAYAQSFTVQDRSRLFSAVALSVVGGVVFASSAPVLGTLFIAAGAASAYRGLVNLQDRNLAAAFRSADDIFENSTSASYSETASDGSSRSLLDRVRRVVGNAVNTGLNGIRSTTVRTINQTTSLASGVTAQLRLPDPTPSSQTLPPQPLLNSALVGSIVDSTGRVFSASGTVSSSGTLDVAATAPDGETLQVNGSVSNGTTAGANGTVGGSVTRVVAGRTVTGTLSTGVTAAVGQCQTLTRSGGQGTFSYAFNLGRSAGQFALSYQMYSIPDSMTIVVGGKTVFTTGGLVSGSLSTTANFSDSDTAFVNMSAPNSGTAWDFTLGCGT